MSRYIDADVLQKDVRIRFYEDYKDGFGYADIDSIINEQPTVDAVPWEFLERYAYWFCNPVSFPQFIRDAKAFYRSYVADMDGFADGERERVK